MSGPEALLGASGSGPLMALVLALLLGLRHATDPDHLTAVVTLVSARERAGARTAGWLGLAWGLGHAVTCVALGLGVVWAGAFLPEAVQAVAELAVGLVIVALAVRLLVRCRRGTFHSHVHTHGDLTHAHPHLHEQRPGERHGREHDHGHPDARSPLTAFGVGLVHGVGGSAAVGVLLVAAMGSRGQAVGLLLTFAVATLLSMALLSAGLGAALVRGPVARRLEVAVPLLGILSLGFGLWYAFDAIAGSIP